MTEDAKRIRELEEALAPFARMGAVLPKFVTLDAAATPETAPILEVNSERFSSILVLADFIRAAKLLQEGER